MLAELGWSSNSVFHFLENDCAGVSCFHKSFLEDGKWDTWKLEVKLVSGHTFAGSTNFEVHVTVEIFTTDDIEQSFVFLDVAVIVHLSNEAHCDRSYGANKWHTCVKQSHGAGTNRCHGR